MTLKTQEKSDQPAATTLQLPRKEEAQRIISKYTGWGAGAGAIPLPLWDIAAVCAVQVKLVKDLLALYERPFSESRARSIVSVLIGSLSPALLAGVTASSLLKFVPGVGAVLAAATLPVLSSASSYAVGRVMLAHLEKGGSLSDFDAEAAKGEFKESFKEAKETATAK
jgi:uncharacterized protein (DUF697 family)